MQGAALHSRNDEPPAVGTSSKEQIGEIDYLVDHSFQFADADFSASSTAKNAMEGLFFDAPILAHLEDAKRWATMGDWHRERGIPWRRGWLLHGEPGTGKSSLARAVAQTLDMPIYQYQLATLSDREFIDDWENMCTPCIALFEDFDAVFDKREPKTKHQSLTFDCVLNQISGVAMRGGVFLIVTTNHLDKIDEAMGVSVENGSIHSTRPGRIDTVLHVGKASRISRARMAARILVDWPDAIADLVAKSDGLTPVQFQEMSIQEAFNRMAEEAQARTLHDLPEARLLQMRDTARTLQSDQAAAE